MHIMYLVQVAEHVRKKVLDQLDLVCGNLVYNIYYVPCTGGQVCTEEDSRSAGSGVWKPSILCILCTLYRWQSMYGRRF